MSTIDSIVTVVITKGTKVVPLPGFGVPAILGPSNRISTDVYRIYTSTAGMISDGFLTSDPEYKHAVALMGQAQKPVRFVVGKYTVAVAQIDTMTPDVSSQIVQHYIATIDLVAYDFTSDATPTAAEVVTGLIALVNGDSACKMVASGTVTLILTAKTAGIGSTVTSSANLPNVASQANHSIVSDIAALQLVYDLWYGLIVTSKTASDILQVAAYVETQLKLYGASSLDAGILTTGTTDIAYVLKARNYDRTFLLFSAEAALGPEAGWIGQMVPQVPGNATWKFKTIAGIAVDNLTETQIANAQGKNCNLFLDVGGVGITTEGVCSSGEYIDVTLFLDWLSSTMKVNVFSPLVNLPKIPYTNKGIAAIENPVRQTLAQGVINGGLSDNPAPTVTVPDVADVSQNDKASRTLNGVEFTGVLAGAIHKVNIQGYVSV